MKYTVGLMMAVAAIGSSAQSLADLPECGQTCVQNMLDQASDLGCNSDDAGCLCQNVNFTYGIRDCTIESCEDDTEGTINYGAEYCRSEGGVVITTAAPGSNTGDSAGTTTATPGTDGSANTGPSETTAGPSQSTSDAATNPDATSDTASGSPTGAHDSDDTGTDEEGGVARKTAATAGLLAAAGVAAILI